MITDEKFSPKQRLALGAVILVLAACGFAVGRTVFNPEKRVVQPIQFNHKKHVQAGLECSGCHELYAEHDHSGLPSLAVCQSCHQQPMTTAAEERKLIDLASRPSPPEFHKLFALPNNVLYSHRRHVTVAKLPCETCHGGIAESSAPPARPLVRVTMTMCTDCHARRHVQTDCTNCHR